MYVLILVHQWMMRWWSHVRNYEYVETEEADLRLLPHGKYTVVNGSKRVIILANDTDIIVGFIYNCQYLKDNGLRELWIRGGVEKISRYIPLHTLGDTIGTAICQQLPAMQCLAGHNADSIFGTKLSGLKRLPFVHLERFGTDPDWIVLRKWFIQQRSILSKS